MRPPVLAALLLVAQTAVHSQSADVLAKRIMEHMAQTLAVQPNYTCVETVERWVTPRKSKRYLQDRVRFEVALVDGKETFAWPGAQKFEVTDLGTMLPRGLVDTGDFATELRELFDGKSATFSALSQEQIGGSIFTRFDFAVPAGRSGLLVNQSNESSAYHGQLYVDPVSLDPRRIHIVVEVQPKHGVSAASKQLDLARVPIGAGNFLLPQSADVSMTRLDDVEFFNHIEFKSCRQFTGDSVLKFDDPFTPPLTPASAPVREITVPAGLYFQVRPEEGFDLTDRAVGDPIRVKLDQDLKSKGSLLFAKGAAVEGRISRLIRTSNVTLVGITLETIVSAAGKASIHPTPWDIRIPRPLAPRPAVNPSWTDNEALIPMRSGINFLSSAILIFWRT
jgi:hypothetical protein